MIMPRFLLDTNILSEPNRREPNQSVLDKLEKYQNEIATATIVWHELLFGCQRLPTVHPETLPKLKLWIPRYPLFGVQSFSFGNIFGVSGWTLPTSRKREKLEQYLYQTVAQLPILPYTQEAAEWHAAERARLSLLGKMPPFADGQIAAIAKVNNLIIVTANVSDYEIFSDVVIENWCESLEE